MFLLHITASFLGCLSSDCLSGCSVGALPLPIAFASVTKLGTHPAQVVKGLWKMPLLHLVLS